MIHLVDDDAAVTDSCRFLLEGLGYTVQCWNNSRIFLTEAAVHYQGVALLDMRMPGLDGHEIFQEMRNRDSTLAVIFLTGHGDIQMAVDEMKWGAVDFLQKPVAKEPLIEAIDRGYHYSRQLNAILQIQKKYHSLTLKEKQVAELVVRGGMNKDIADQLNVSLRTVEVHRSRVMEKMDVDSLATLVSQWDKLHTINVI
ncbi:response regulator transcription factor [Buttiauxella sp. B2]|uniref:tetrathionate respiration response regulator TtrR n=1 Tax=Buttiauxella sp. B2 TaxID=2587812 RepID=UPI0011202C72|nr:tetrathionate respiration response regulator TtrR [Buttiauxella sp. B2]TNV16834.1 response regulator transcription factor [Buttiauxella sp. B2]